MGNASLASKAMSYRKQLFGDRWRSARSLHGGYGAASLTFVHEISSAG
jgi:hypothetical protein